jgi:4-hydroxy-3-polyprenylbenzoate decarboxylase
MGPCRERQRLIVGISGATGVVYAIRLLDLLKTLDVETHLVITKSAEMTIRYESDVTVKQIRERADVHYAIGNVGAAISSGSFRTMGMIVVPCSMRTVAEIATGATSNLLTRAADVCLKERRRLALIARETPLHAGHLKAMLAVTECGGIIVPPVPAFYMRPGTLGDVVDHTVGRILDLFGFDVLNKRWDGNRTELSLGSDEGNLHYEDRNHRLG